MPIKIKAAQYIDWSVSKVDTFLMTEALFSVVSIIYITPKAAENVC